MTRKSLHSVLAVLSQWFPASPEQELANEMTNLTTFLEDSYPELNHEEVASAAVAVLAILRVVKLRSTASANEPS